jgi:hypothetical protein
MDLGLERMVVLGAALPSLQTSQLATLARWCLLTLTRSRSQMPPGPSRSIRHRPRCTSAAIALGLGKNATGGAAIAALKSRTPAAVGILDASRSTARYPSVA